MSNAMDIEKLISQHFKINMLAHTWAYNDPNLDLLLQ